jgi:LysM repeat protein
MKKIFITIIAVVVLQLVVVSATYASGGSDGGGVYHRVRYGETLFSIGRLYDRHPYHIAEVNGLYDPNYIYAGQVLYIPEGSRYPWEAHDRCGYDYGCNDYGYDRSGYRDNCDYGCDNDGYRRSGYQDNCGYGCDQDGYGRPGYGNNYGRDNCGGCGSGYNNMNYGYNNNCGGCGSNYGYDYTGYYYGNTHKRYSYTCGYYSNCW